MKVFGKTLLTGIVMAGLFIGHVGVAAAATKMCFSAVVTRVGVTPSDTGNGNTGYRFEVEGGSCALPANSSFFLSTDLGDAGLATLLTAFSMDKPITMRVTDPVVKDSLVGTIHLDK